MIKSDKKIHIRSNTIQKTMLETARRVIFYLLLVPLFPFPAAHPNPSPLLRKRSRCCSDPGVPSSPGQAVPSADHVARRVGFAPSSGSPPATATSRLHSVAKLRASRRRRTYHRRFLIFSSLAAAFDSSRLCLTP
jgi:hypothetical protein